jgi:hypothetical protein
MANGSGKEKIEINFEFDSQFSKKKIKENLVAEIIGENCRKFRNARIGT